MEWYEHLLWIIEAILISIVTGFTLPPLLFFAWRAYQFISIQLHKMTNGNGKKKTSDLTD